MPLCLKEWLIDDFDAIMQQNKVKSIMSFVYTQNGVLFQSPIVQLVKVPCHKTVASILNDYKEFKLNEADECDERYLDLINPSIQCDLI